MILELWVRLRIQLAVLSRVLREAPGDSSFELLEALNPTCSENTKSPPGSHGRSFPF